MADCYNTIRQKVGVAVKYKFYYATTATSGRHSRGLLIIIKGDAVECLRRIWFRDIGGHSRGVP